MSYKKRIVLLYFLAVLIPLLVFGLTVKSMNNKVISVFNSEFPDTEFNLKNNSIHRYVREYETTISDYPSLAKSSEYNDLLFGKYQDIKFVEVLIDQEVVYSNSKEEANSEDLIDSSFDFETEIGIINLSIKHPEVFSTEALFKRIFMERTILSLIVYISLHVLFLLIIMKKTIPDTKRLTDIADSISKGNYDIELDIKRRDEIGDMYRAFDNMKVSLETYENNRKELIANISHDLKTPIATINGYVTGIQDGLASSPEKLDKYLNIIVNNTKHIDGLINDLFLYSKLDVDQAEFNFKPVHFDKFIDYYIDELKLDLEEQNINIEWTMPELKNSIVMTDGFRMRQVANNIINNAVKHMDKEIKLLKFHVSCTKNYLTFKIEDNGRGIPEEQLVHIFERFYRGDASRNTIMGSSGLGLAIVKQIVEKHNGTIYAESILGQSTTVTICLPLEGDIDG